MKNTIRSLGILGAIFFSSSAHAASLECGVLKHRYSGQELANSSSYEVDIVGQNSQGRGEPLIELKATNGSKVTAVPINYLDTPGDGFLYESPEAGVEVEIITEYSHGKMTTEVDVTLLKDPNYTAVCL